MKLSTPSFGIFLNNVRNKDGDLKYRGDTTLFREDLNFPRIVDFLDKKYKNTPKVNVIMHACSDGEEVYSFLAVLFSKLKENIAKFLPLKANDINTEHLKIAQRGVYNITRSEYNRGNKYLNGDFDIYFEPMLSSIFSQNTDLTYTTRTVKVEHSLKSFVNFRKGDILYDAENMNFKNTILFARNFWPYLSSGQREKLAQILSKKMDSTSTLIIGEYDKSTANIDLLLGKYGFVEEIENVFIIPQKNNYLSKN